MDTRRYDPRRARAAAMVLVLACLPLAAAWAASGGGAAAGGPGSPGRESVNLVVILDVSTSMRGAFASMQDYIHGSVVGKILKTGDYFRLYTFGVEVRSVYSGTVELPRDEAALRDLIYAMKPDEEGTDIGLMLAELDRFLRAERLPNPLTSVVWATDGKNDPPRGSPYAGRDVFDPKAFSAYSILKSAEYKVLLLSIGSNTAAKDLAGPMGGDYPEFSYEPGASPLVVSILAVLIGIATACFAVGSSRRV